MSDVNEALRTLLRDKPELLDDAQELVETMHYFLYDGDGGDPDGMIEVFNGVIPAILEAAKEVPALREWAEKLDALAKTMYAQAA